MVSLAERIATVLSPVVPELKVGIRAWDGSRVGPLDAPLIDLRSPRVLRRLLWSPGELGASQAYVTGEVDVVGDLDDALARLRSSIDTASPLARRLKALVLAGKLGLDLRAFGPRPEPPRSQAVIRGRLHTRTRDIEAIHHHYDLSNDFYELILDESMAYSCAYFSRPDMTLEAAQRAKLDLICTKLALAPGATLLDIGCGWGSLATHAAQAYGASVTAVTIAEEQYRYVTHRVETAGLDHLVNVRLCDYRDVSGHFDAVSSVEMGEHVGEYNYPIFAGVIHDRLRAGGRALVQQMSRTGKHPGGGPFIESFIAPDMHMRPLGETVGLLEEAGLEVRDVQAMREHYVATVAYWLERFEKNIDLLTDLVGEEVVRVWRLYLVGGAAAFRDGRMGVDQILAVRPGTLADLPGYVG